PEPVEDAPKTTKEQAPTQIENRPQSELFPVNNQRPDTDRRNQPKTAPLSAGPLPSAGYLVASLYDPPPAMGVAGGALATDSASSTPSALAMISLVLSMTSGFTEMEVIPHSTSFWVSSG
ncbi:hypothetical protein LCGC14_2148770, partial [marine sediment metagenome]